jgi:hypothetical protein
MQGAVKLDNSPDPRGMKDESQEVKERDCTDEISQVMKESSRFNSFIK